ncbi:protein NO VEIN domain-containing protein [Stappia indica]|uniref:protein NO VEIN domain-containing protein n=1 Tax=Stappia indica TaxID=538381 RepID=UPI001D187E7A|nr:DUF3883 domain-containing protein [Stappia indica]MCC4243718.1 DUF3883 domain-containing protein [Stappia indica]
MLLICHVVWMPSYSGEKDVHAGGFDYVIKFGYGHELFNFMQSDDFCYGFVQVRTGTIDISRLGADKKDTFIDGVTVVWTAPHPEGGRLVVGWYKSARVYRNFQLGKVAGRKKDGDRVGYSIQAAAKDCFLVPVEERNFSVPHSQHGTPGQHPVFYPENSKNRNFKKWLVQCEEYIANWGGRPIGVSGLISEPRPIKNSAGKGWPATPDVAHNAAVEAAAITIVRDHFVNMKADRQKDNCGWDLEFWRGDDVICVEVKGLTGNEVSVELTPNEYQAMRKAVEGTFDSGEYRLAVACNVLGVKPKLFIFKHESGAYWICERTSKRIRLVERTAARLS